MHVGGIVGRAAGLLVTGLAGAVALEGVKKVVRRDVVRGAAVNVTAWGLRGGRAAETGAERLRLGAADIVSEAREKLGEQTPAPGASDYGDHDHEH